MVDSPLRVRWLGQVGYDEAWSLQKRLFESNDNHLALLEHPAVFTLGKNGKLEHLLVGTQGDENIDAVDPADVVVDGATVRRVDRGGDITFHGPGQLVGYPVMNVQTARGGGMADTKAYVCSVEQTIIDALDELGVSAFRVAGYPGVWVKGQSGQNEKVAAVGVRLSRGRSMHGFALNVDPDLTWFDKIVPCGIKDSAVTSLRELGVEASMQTVVEHVARAAVRNLWSNDEYERMDVAWKHSVLDLSPFSRGEGPGTPTEPAKKAPAKRSDTGPGPDSRAVPVRLQRRLDQAGVSDGLAFGDRKPSWMRVKLETNPEFRRLKSITRDLQLTTVCEEAGCPNIFDCWNEGTATFMLLGERCTRACGFCLIDTRKPDDVDWDEPARVAEAISQLSLRFAVLTMVARDDLADGGAAIVAETVRAIAQSSPDVGVEVLISDLAGSAASLQTVCDAEPAIVNHNIETVPRLQRAVRPSAGYARSLTVLARAAAAGRVTKSGLIVGMGETFEEVVSTMADLSAVGVRIVTIGQYLRPTSNHLPIHRWWEPAEFDELKAIGEEQFGFEHVAASPLTRSSHHAGSIAASL